MTNEEIINYINSIKHMFENGINRTTRNCTVLGGEALELHKKYIEACESAVQVIVTVDQKHTGEWKETGYETGALGITYRQTQCSNCGWEHALPMRWNFCPNCGAKMKED